MSWEGYDQVLCANGHQGTLDAFYCEFGVHPLDSPCHCGAKIVWWNQVNETNGSHEMIDGKEVRVDGFVYLKEKTPNIFCTCSGCGNNHISKGATFELPDEGIGHRIP